MTPRPLTSLAQRHRIRGVALISALLLVALATSTAVFIASRASLRLRDAENTQALSQAKATARAAIDFGRWALRQDLLRDTATNTAVDSLTEPWAQSLPAFPVENGSVSGLVTDAQARINLNNLGLNHGAGDALLIQTLLLQAHLDPTLANALRDWVDADDQATLPGGAEDIDYLAMTPGRRAANRPLVDVDELLQVRGFTPDAVAALRPFVTALPVHTPVNINTATAPVLMVLFRISSSDAEAMLAARQLAPFTGVTDLMDRGPPALVRQLGSSSGVGTAVVAASTTPGAETGSAPPQFHQDWDVASAFFLIDARATYGQVQYGLSALVQRANQTGYPSILWERRTLF